MNKEFFSDHLTSKASDILLELDKVIIGQQYLKERLLISLLTNGHVLLEGLPGLAKTLAIKSLANICDMSFKRIQFTPDLLPSDLIGTLIYNQKDGDFFVKKGPLFTNFVLADEINRAPAKVQSALLEAMQEKQITIGDNTYNLDLPFMVMATQNPIEQEGTYPLPEAQIDRFMFKLKISYPSREEEIIILTNNANENEILLNKVITKDDLIELKTITNNIFIDEELKKYIVDIVHATREPYNFNLSELTNYIKFGASPRATIFLVQAAKGLALINKRNYVIPDDIKIISFDVLRHRIILSYEAEADNVTTENIISKIISKVDVP